MSVYGSMKLRGYTWYHNWVFRENHVLLQEYLDDVWDRIEHEAVMKEFEEDPHLGYQVLADFKNNKYDPNINWEKILDHICHPGNDIIIISGSKRSGKTYDAWRFMDALKDEYEPYWIGEPSNIPEWCHESVDLYSMPPGSIGVVDESAIKMNNRNAMSNQNKKLLEILPIIAHSGRKAIFITQNTSRSDVALLSWADLHVQKQYSGVYSRTTEREAISNKTDPYFLPLLSNKEWSYAVASNFRGLYKGYSLPWYDDTISKSFKTFDSEKEALTYATRMAISDYEAPDIEQIMRLRGFSRPMHYWEEFVTSTRTNPAKAISMVQKSSIIQAMC